MFRIIENGNHRLDITLSGKLESAEMRSLLDELVEKSAGIENGLMLYDLIDFHLPSLGAIAIELSRLPAMFKLIKQFHRVAVLTDKAWVRKASELEGELLPELEIRSFTREQRSAAEDWLQHMPPIL
jgi:hypothetical protein